MCSSCAREIYPGARRMVELAHSHSKRSEGHNRLTTGAFGSKRAEGCTQGQGQNLQTHFPAATNWRRVTLRDEMHLHFSGLCS
jgi:hypothetical protein